MEIDWNETGKTGVITALKEVPEVGAVLGLVVGQLWPSSTNDIWDQIRAKVHELIDQSLSTALVSRINEQLDGLRRLLQQYHQDLAVSEPKTCQAIWLSVQDFFLDALPAFQHNQQDGDYRLLLLPEFTQFANLYLGVLRDGVLAGKTWWSDKELDKRKKDLRDRISEFVQYVPPIYQAGLKVKRQTPTDAHRCQPFRTVNEYVRFMTLSVLDYAETWPYYDPEATLDPPTPALNREIYSDPFGTADTSGPIRLPWTAPPTNVIDRVLVYGNVYSNRIRAIEVRYYQDKDHPGGPNGARSIGPMGAGGVDGHELIPPLGGTCWVGPSKLKSINVAAGDVLQGITLYTTDGRHKQFADEGGAFITYDGHIISSLYVNGESSFYGSPDALIVGFMRESALPDPPPD